MRKKEVCGADAETVINRGDFGITYGLGAPFNFKPEVKLLISVEALADS
jgi:polyisoprenoid-binding protein YceI